MKRVSSFPSCTWERKPVFQAVALLRSDGTAKNNFEDKLTVPKCNMGTRRRISWDRAGCYYLGRGKNLRGVLNWSRRFH